MIVEDWNPEPPVDRFDRGERWALLAILVFFLCVPWLIGVAALIWGLTQLGWWAWGIALLIGLGVPACIYNHHTFPKL